MRPLQRQIEWCARAQLVLAGAMVLFFACFFVFGYRVANQKLSDLRMQIQSKQRDLATNQSQANLLDPVTDEVEKLKNKLANNGSRLPHQEELPQFIREITQASQQASLRKFEYKPGIGHRGELFSEMPITMTFEGDFMNVASFLRQTEQMQRLTRVQNVTIKNKGAKPGEVEVQVSMNIYYSEG